MVASDLNMASVPLGGAGCSAAEQRLTKDIDGGHRGGGWETFTDRVVECLSERDVLRGFFGVVM